MEKETKKYVSRALPINAYQVDVPTIIYDKYGNAVVAGVDDYVIVNEHGENEVKKKHVFEAEYKEVPKKDTPAK